MALSISTMGLLLQRESVPGTPETDAMKRYHGIRGTIGWEVERESFRAAGSKAVTGENVITEMGTADLEVTQDYNAFLPLLAGVFGEPTTTALVATPTAAYEHVFEIDPYDADAMVAFTTIFGSASRALQASYMVPHGMGLTISRTSLDMSATAILRAPETGVTYPSSGVVDVPMIPVRAASYNAYIDNSWAALGTTQMLSFYNTEYNFGEKYGADWVVNRNLTSFSELLENTDIDYTQSLRVGFDATSEAMIDDALQGGRKFVRVDALGPDINGTDNYALQVDTCVSLTPNDVRENQDSPAVVVNFDGTLNVDATSGKFARVTLINTLAEV